MEKTKVKRHVRKRKNGASVVRRHDRMLSPTHRIKNGKKEVFVGFWKPDFYPTKPTKNWSLERLLKEKSKVENDLWQSTVGTQRNAHGKFGLMVRRLKKVTHLIEQKRKLE